MRSFTTSAMRVSVASALLVAPHTRANPRPVPPIADPLAYAVSLNNGSSWTAGGTLTVPAATACVATISPPVILPLGFASVRPVIVTITTTAPGASTFYRLTGAGYSPSQPYAGPFVLDDPGNTTVLAYSAKAGALTSATTVATYVISLSSNPNVTAVGVACSPYGASGRESSHHSCPM